MTEHLVLSVVSCVVFLATALIPFIVLVVGSMGIYTALAYKTAALYIFLMLAYQLRQVLRMNIIFKRTLIPLSRACHCENA